LVHVSWPAAGWAAQWLLRSLAQLGPTAPNTAAGKSGTLTPHRSSWRRSNTLYRKCRFLVRYLKEVDGGGGRWIGSGCRVTNV